VPLDLVLLNQQRPQHQSREVFVGLRQVRRIGVGKRTSGDVDLCRFDPFRDDDHLLEQIVGHIPRQRHDPLQWSSGDIDLTCRPQLRTRLRGVGRARFQDGDLELGCRRWRQPLRDIWRVRREFRGRRHDDDRWHFDLLRLE
jgi:hypothetical protein